MLINVNNNIIRIVYVANNIIRIVYVANAHKIIICSIAKVNVKQKVMRVEEPQMAPRHQVIQYHSNGKSAAALETFANSS